MVARVETELAAPRDLEEEVVELKRRRHIKAAADAAAGEVEYEDDAYLLKLDKLLGKCFIDVHPTVERGHAEYWEETRKIVEIQRSEALGVYVAKTKKFKRNGVLNKNVDGDGTYGLSEDELVGVYADIARYEERHGVQEAVPAPGGAGPAAVAAL